jgi:glutaredoxin
MSRLILVAVTALYAVGASAQMYRWVDKDGRVHYTDTPPAGAARSVERRTGTPSVIETNQAPYAVQQATRNFPVTLYTSANCGDACNDARNLLTRRGVPFREVAVTDEKSVEELKRISGGDSIPVMTVGRSVTRGFEPDMWHNALDAGGYPRSSSSQTAQAQKRAVPPASTAATNEAPKSVEAQKPAEEETPQRRGPYLPR